MRPILLLVGSVPDSQSETIQNPRDEVNTDERDGTPADQRRSVGEPEEDDSALQAIQRRIEQLEQEKRRAHLTQRLADLQAEKARGFVSPPKTTPSTLQNQ